MTFDSFLTRNNCFIPNTEVMDIGAGAGANIFYFAKKHKRIKFTGFDYNKKLVDTGKSVLKKNNLPNVSLEYGDWFKLPKSLRNRFAGIINIHTLCVFKELTPALHALIELNPAWMAFNSLFYEGPLDVIIHIREYKPNSYSDNNPDGDFNIFSLPFLKRYMNKHGYSKFMYKKFYIPVDLPKPKDGSRGTYTVKTDFEKRSLFSGPVYLPWYFVLASKESK